MIRTKEGSNYFRSVDKQSHLIVDVGLDDRSMFIYIYLLIITILKIFINNLTKLFDFQVVI